MATRGVSASAVGGIEGTPCNNHSETRADGTKGEITFKLNGKTVRISDRLDARMTLLEYLREHTRLTGTKASCTQGGCGACNVMLTTYKHGEVQYSSINACLRPLMSLDGLAITTTEGIGSRKIGYHPVQERLADCNGTQCGFCTPGHVMAMYSALRDKGDRPMTAVEVEERLDGNICRCTGYRPILTAAQSFSSDGENKTDVTGLANSSFEKYDPSSEPPPPIDFLAAETQPLRIDGSNGTQWLRPTNLTQLCALKRMHPTAVLVCGNTSTGVYGPHDAASTFIDVSRLPELSSECSDHATGLLVPAATTLTQLRKHLEARTASSGSFIPIVNHLKKVASWQVRNVGSVAGNLMMVRRRHFMSDVATLLMGTGATVQILRFDTEAVVDVPLLSFLRGEEGGDVQDEGFVLTSIMVPFLAANEHYRTYRVAQRTNNSHAFINAAMRMRVDAAGCITEAHLAFGCVGTLPTFASAAERALVGCALAAKETMETALLAIEGLDVEPIMHYHSIRQSEGKDPFRRVLPATFLYKFILAVRVAAGVAIPTSLHSTAMPAERIKSRASQTFKSEMPSGHPGRDPRPKLEAREQASGETIYHDDLQPARPLYAAFVQCTSAPALITSIDASAALEMPGVVSLISAEDVPAFNNASLVPGEEVLFPTLWRAAEHSDSDDEAKKVAKKASRVLYVGQPVAAIVGRSRREVETAARHVKVTYDTDGEVGIYSIQDALEAKSFLPTLPGCTNAAGDVDKALAADGIKVVEGQFSLGGQSHFCMEKHTTMAVPEENGRMVLHSSTQAPEFVRNFAAATLGVTGEKVQVITRRCGGAFGGKVTKNLPSALTAAIAARKLEEPVKMQVSIAADMTMSGHCRHPLRVNYRAGVDESTGRIVGFDVKVVMDAGCSTDFSAYLATEINNNLELVYHVEHYRADVQIVWTNTPSNTAVRGPGLAQAMAISETMMEHLAISLGEDVHTFRTRNLMTDRNCMTMHKPPFHLKSYNVPAIWAELEKSAELDSRKAAINAFNHTHTWVKRGVCMVPMRYYHSHSFNAGTTCLVSVHGEDGTVEVHHGGTEIGQGITTKIAQMVAVTLGVAVEKVFVHATNTGVLPQLPVTCGICRRGASNRCLPLPL